MPRSWQGQARSRLGPAAPAVPVLAAPANAWALLVLPAWLVLGTLETPSASASPSPASPASGTGTVRVETRGPAARPFPERLPPAGARFRSISLDDGLVQSTVYAIAQGPRGLIYMGTERGLASFDGFRFTPVEPLADGVASVLAVDERGWLLAGDLGQGLVGIHLASGEATVLGPDSPAPAKLAGSTVQALEPADGGRWWVATEEGLDLVQIDEDGARVVAPPLLGPPGAADSEGWGEDGILALERDPGGRLWLGLAEGLVRFDPSTRAVRTFAELAGEPFPFGAVLDLLLDGDGRLYAAARGGLLRLDTASGRARIWAASGGDTSDGVDRAGPSHATVRALRLDRHGLLWVGTAGGLDCFDPASGGWRAFHRDPSDPTSPADDNVRALFEDSSGLLWVGTTGGGALRYDPAQQRFWRLGPRRDGGLAHPFVWSLYVDPDRTLWVGTAGGGLDRFDGATGEVTRFRHEPGDPASLGGDHVLALTRDRSGFLWVGTTDGHIERLDAASGRFEHFGRGPSSSETRTHRSGEAPRLPVRALLEDGAGEMWVAHWGGGLSRLDRHRRKLEPFPRPSTRLTGVGNLPAGAARITAMVEESTDGGRRPGTQAGTLWIATYGAGLHALDRGRETYAVFRHRPDDPSSLVDDRLVSLAAASGGGLWLGTNGGQLARFDPSTERSEEQHWRSGHPELRAISLYSILEDERGRLWLGTNRGLIRHVPWSGETRRFDVGDGLQSPEHNAGAVFHHRSTGELYFGGTRGVERFHPDALVDSPFQPPVVLTAIRRFGQELEIGRPPAYLDEVELSYRDRYVSFEYAALDYRNPGKNRYAFRLEGQDDAWVQAGTRNLASYTNLSGGHYTLRVLGTSSDGRWGSGGLSLRVRVVPPFWQMAGFRVALAGFLLGLAFFVPAAWYRRQLSRLAERRRNEVEIHRQLLRARERERTRVARELHDGPLQELYALRLRRAGASEAATARGPGGPVDPATDRDARALGRIAGQLRRLCG
ncbi:MAG: histidine kinase, partial [Holophagales bacterium]|nr:histidine kinase [Holophagales bacterium]